MANLGLQVWSPRWLQRLGTRGAIARSIEDARDIWDAGPSCRAWIGDALKCSLGFSIFVESRVFRAIAS